MSLWTKIIRQKSGLKSQYFMSETSWVVDQSGVHWNAPLKAVVHSGKLFAGWVLNHPSAYAFVYYLAEWTSNSSVCLHDSMNTIYKTRPRGMEQDSCLRYISIVILVVIILRNFGKTRPEPSAGLHARRNSACHFLCDELWGHGKGIWVFRVWILLLGCWNQVFVLYPP